MVFVKIETSREINFTDYLATVKKKEPGNRAGLNECQIKWAVQMEVMGSILHPFRNMYECELSEGGCSAPSAG